ncbi:galactose-1-phosphate uridylyltransferase [candidate division KSB1 bacterium]|nr:galactose-1-phosphate uridylyltransferase [candidate division KSB1 bacterium]
MVNGKRPPELRKDPIIGRWVIISTERSKRPTDWNVDEEKKKGGFCPFCPGNEDKTPPEVYAIRSDNSAANTQGWKVRVVSNKFPALQVEGELNRRGEGIFDLMNGIGAHEVIIETPDHFLDLADLPVPQIREIFWAVRERMIDLSKDERFKYILAFKNNGVSAGASLEHSHTQLIATPIVPKRVLEEIQGVRQYYQYKERCIFCDVIRQELQTEKRLVVNHREYIAIEPFAARFPFETWLLPKYHNHRFEDMTYDDALELATIVKDVLKRLNKALETPPYNFIIHTSPLLDQESPEYHWHLEIIPKLTKVAGFEWGSGFYINPTPPEIAAETLRDLSF